ncbi:hypothetical protein SLS58_002821 [Diplodia intermedia]|uniref:Amidohydrolase-related domain-containing protein n=1 Tax=Diplodia intermedia TaxID=856260 RepID=A0ABR3TY21_9PEZI
MTDTNTSIIIKHGTFITMDPALGVLRDCDILIEGNTITKIAPNITTDAASTPRTIDATNSLVSPGYIDGHHHLWQQLLRDWSLADYVVATRTCIGSLYTPADVYTATYAGAVDLPHHGVTTVVDHCHAVNTSAHADAAVAALAASRIRAAFC